MKRQFIWVRILFALFILLGITSNAQINYTDSLTTEAPKPVALTDIASNIELVVKQLKSIEKKTKDYKAARRIDSLLPIYRSSLEQKMKEFQNFKNSHPNKQKVINLINKWASYSSYLVNWQKTINSYLDKNSVWLIQLDVEDKRWAATLIGIEENKESDVYKNVVNLRKQIQGIIKRLNEQNDYLLDLQTEILIQKEGVNEIQEELEIWKKSEQFSIFYKRHLPIWKISQEKAYSQGEEFDSWYSFKSNVSGVIGYLKSPENNLIGFSFVLLLLGFAIIRLSFSFKKLTTNIKDQNLSQSRFILVQKTFWVVLFVFTISTIVYFSHTPIFLSEILLLIGLVTAIPIINSAINKKFKGLTVLVIFLYIMNTLKAYVWYSSTFYRIYLFAESIIVLAIAFKYVHPYLKTRRLDVTPLTRVIIKLAPVVFTLMLIAIVSNAIGLTNFTDLTLGMTIKGAVLVVVFYAMLTVLKAIARAAVHRNFQGKEDFDYTYKLYLENKLNQFVTLFSYAFLIIYFLHVVDLYDALVKWITEELSDPIQAGTITFTWGSIFTFVLVLAGSFIITSFISRIVDGGGLNFLRLPKGVAAIISVIIRYFLIAFGFVIALSYLGIDLSKFNLMAGALGLGIGFGLQNIISNFISGLILIFERPIQSNDVVEVGTLLGQVKKIGVRSSNIRTFDGAEVVVPNSNLISNEVINWTLSDNIKRIEILIGTEYGSDLQQVVDILNEEATNDSRVLKDPKPRSLFNGFGDSSLNFRLLFWVAVDNGIQTKSDVSIAIYNRFKVEGIVIPFPQRDINFKKKDIEALRSIKDKGESTENIE